MTTFNCTLDDLKRAGKEFVDALKDPTLEPDQACNGWKAFGLMYLGCNVEGDPRAELEAPILYTVISREWMKYAVPRGLL